MTRIILVLLWVAFHALAVSAGGGAWTGGGPFGGKVYDLVGDSSQPGRYYVGTVNGPFRSDDSGASWVRVADGANQTIRNLTIADDGVLYAIDSTDDRPALRSMNGGLTWATLPSPVGTPRQIAVAPGNSDRVLLLMSVPSGLYRSLDGGQTWHVSDPGPSLMRECEFDPTTDLIAYCATSGGVIRTTDGGATWNAVAGSLSFLPARIAVSRTAPGTVLAGGSSDVAVTTNGGDSWSESDNVRGEDDVDISSTNALHMLVNRRESLWSSSDGGVSWTSLPDAARQFTTYRAAFATGSTTEIFFANRYGLRRSTDAGATWHDRVAGLQAFDDRVTASPSSGVVAFDEFGRLRTTDGGATWTAANTGLPQPAGGLTPDPTDPARAFWFDLSGVWESTDTAATWTEVTPAGIPINFGSLDIDPNLASRRILGHVFIQSTQAPALSITNDDGSSWSQQLPIDPSWDWYYPLDVAFPAHDRNLLLVTGGGLDGGWRCWVERSQDGGSVWTKVLDEGPSGQCLAVIEANPVESSTVFSLFFSGSESQLRRSTDSGGTWDLLDPPFAAVSIAAGPTAGELYAAAERLYRSTDDGDTWAPFSTEGLPRDLRYLRSVDLSRTNPPVLWIATNAGVYSYTSRIFSDGFESGDTSAWSATLP